MTKKSVLRHNVSFLFCLLLLPLFLVGPSSIHGQLAVEAEAGSNPLESALGDSNPAEAFNFLNTHHQLRIVALLTVLSLLPFGVVMMTSFTRITIILHLLRQALATQQVPSNQIIAGLSLILTAFVMHPVITDIQENALTPYMNDDFKHSPEVAMGIKGEDTLLAENTWRPLRNFMLHHTREKDLLLFLEIGQVRLPKIDPEDVGNDETGSAYDLEAIPWYCLVPGFILSELRTAFMMGFLLFMPFLVIDMIIASILMSMGMMMLPPVMISMPFKILLFIVIDGWRLIIQQIVTGYYPLG